MGQVKTLQGPWKGTHLDLWKTELEPLIRKPKWKVAISRKLVRLATERNRWKRRIREILRQQEGLMQQRCTVVLRVHHVTGLIKYTELEREILELLHKSGLLPNKEK